MLNATKRLACLSFFVYVSLASPGDRLPEFSDCVRACEVVRHCTDRFEEDSFNPFINEQFSEPALVYKALLWDCTSDCDYQCQQKITLDREERNEDIYQFHGKWPFKRVLGMQEFYSTIFSICNFVPHYRGFKLARKSLAKLQKTSQRRVLILNYIFISMAGMIAWICSSIFHTRDLIITEKLDYVFAGATVLSGFHGVFYRVARLDLHPRVGALFSLSVFTIFVGHLLRLYLNWSYAYNMRFNIFFGLLQYILLITLAILNYRTFSSIRPDLVHDLSVVPVLLVVFTGVAMSSELFDFFSYRWQIDSHAIWHALTIVPSFYLYEFFLKDYHVLGSRTSTNIKNV
ncbi:Per1p [Kluyveromyces lactis]|uniref:Post-GPI attachment to proteins factor 3 n=1 Tax=Kluyveromyces lactis (strain ATCC 8585 / CBS 2359 / DSM 70799 / NBRC 1267 / NRRL Y-1140 / WM37) TaxID=284590 RepID=Q6CUU9_KLULA|nr:uncharacterized protein KLLA0_C02101g [Kluyveromyces lactis]CAH01141.1 KLLA0C02101p [Kluyveromyces lactis]|eukprot:XP_452290.1 uncharacterized protein KLLA0_C02101g [Kluyveromyces lactis]